MKTIKLIIPILSLALFSTSCKKDKNEPTPSNPAATNTSIVGQFFTNNLASEKQTFTLNATTGGYIYGAKGGMLYFQPNSFVTSSGATVTGMIDIELIEVYDKATMIKLNKTTTSNGQLLVSGGEWKVSASQNGNPLSLAPGMNYSGQIPTANPNMNMSLFYANESANGNLDWIPADSLNFTDSVAVMQDSVGFVYDFNGSTLGWINVDMFYNDPNPKTTVRVVTPNGHDNSNTIVLIHFSSLNAAANMWYETPVNNFTTSNIPTGLAVTFIVISEINGQYYSAFVPATISNNHVETVTMNATTAAAIANDINNL